MDILNIGNNIRQVKGEMMLNSKRLNFKIKDVY